MPLVPFSRLMADAERGDYAVGYFESWNLESLQAVADAAEASRSPVILGFSGIYLPHPARLAKDSLADYHALGAAVCQRLPVPACLLFNESPDFAWVQESIRLGFGLVMFADEAMEMPRLVECTRRTVELAHAAGVAVEGEVDSLPGIGGDLLAAPAARHLTDPAAAADFQRATGVDALAVNVGQAHIHGRGEVKLDMERLSAIRRAAGVPLVLHGASSLARRDIGEAITRGVRKFNVGSALKRACFEAIRAGCGGVGPAYNPYEVMGSGLRGDVMMSARLAVQKVAQDFMELFRSAGRAGR